MDRTEFQQKISQPNKPVVVDFWAQWCAPCRLTKPVLERLAEEYGGSVEFLAVDADTSHELVEHYKILGIPTVLAFRNGQEAARVIGARGEAGYRQMFASLAQGKQVELSLAPFERMLRIGAGVLLVVIGVSIGSWLAVVAGSVLAFLGVYDRCPVWKAITRMLQAKESEL